jgi:hypothetical protein
MMLDPASDCTSAPLADDWSFLSRSTASAVQVDAMTAITRLIVAALAGAWVLFCLGALPTVALAQDDIRVGIWELNLAKSTFSPGPAPKQQTLTFKAAGPHWTALLQGVDASGKPINPDMSNLMINFDGKDHPTPSPDYDASVWRRVTPYKYEVDRKRAGKVVLTSANEVSSDGKTMTITTTGTNAGGQTVRNISVYDRR